jgi:hypothetical protein
LDYRFPSEGRAKMGWRMKIARVQSSTVSTLRGARDITSLLPNQGETDNDFQIRRQTDSKTQR